ncbi:putative ribonuclease H-like domain-containing protein [Tanacetum coccineum]
MVSNSNIRDFRANFMSVEFGSNGSEVAASLAKWSGYQRHKPRIVNTARSYRTPVNTVRPRIVNTARSYRTPVNTVRPRIVNTAWSNKTSVNAARANGFNFVNPSACWGKPQHDDKGFVDSGCSRHMTGNIAYLFDFKQFDGGGAYGGKISGKEFKNKVMDDFCREKGIKREYSVARTPQQNGVAERRNRTLIEAARTMLADSKLPTTFWAEAVSTACYVQNRVLVVKPHNKTPYELFRGFKPALSFMRPFGCHVTILNTLDSLGKFDGKSDEGFFVGYSLSSKAFRVYNTRTKRVEENLHIGFLENKPMIEGTGPKWLFDIDSLTQSMNYVPVSAGTVSNVSNVDNGEPKTADNAQKQVEDGLNNENVEQERFADDSSSKDVNAVAYKLYTCQYDVFTGSLELNVVGLSVSTASQMKKTTLKKNQKVLSYMEPLRKKSMLLNHQDLKILTIQTKFTSYDQGSLWVASRFSPRSSGMKLWYYLLSNGFKRGKIDQIYDWVFDVSHHLDQISCLHDYAGAPLDRKSTTGGCQFFGKHVDILAVNEAGSGQVQDVIWGCECSTRFEITSKQSINPPLSRGYTLGSGEDSMKLIGIDEIFIRRDLYLDDAEGTDYLLTATIFEELARMGAKSTAWNEFSSSMASLIICLATNQKFNLSKYIFDAMVKHLDRGFKFLLYLRFLHVFINQQLGNMSTHKKIIVYPFHTKKVFANMKRARKDFYGRIIPLFDTMMVQPVEEMGEDSDHPTDSTPIHIIDQPSSSS